MVSGSDTEVIMSRKSRGRIVDALFFGGGGALSAGVWLAAGLAFGLIALGGFLIAAAVVVSLSDGSEQS